MHRRRQAKQSPALALPNPNYPRNSVLGNQAFAWNHHAPTGILDVRADGREPPSRNPILGRAAPPTRLQNAPRRIHFPGHGRCGRFSISISHPVNNLPKEQPKPHPCACYVQAETQLFQWHTLSNPSQVAETQDSSSPNWVRFFESPARRTAFPTQPTRPPRRPKSPPISLQPNHLPKKWLRFFKLPQTAPLAAPHKRLANTRPHLSN